MNVGSIAQVVLGELEFEIFPLCCQSKSENLLERTENEKVTL